MSWSDRYIGTPYAEFGRDRTGCDCWGLACIIYRQELGISLPDYLGYGSVEEHGEISALVSGAVVSPLWVPISGTAAAFDIAVFRRGRMSTHVGIVIRHGLMIHIEGDDCAKVADYRTGCWKYRLTGHYRHFERATEYPAQTNPEAV
ncbi:NlpC/P60 family protein [Brucella anthropi]|uniref:NlpC/P60 family protein n=1 Tax=Brucella anthropi TaxID=529 RepID=UPI00384B2DD3